MLFHMGFLSFFLSDKESESFVIVTNWGNNVNQLVFDQVIFSPPPKQI